MVKRREGMASQRSTNNPSSSWHESAWCAGTQTNTRLEWGSSGTRLFIWSPYFIDFTSCLQQGLEELINVECGGLIFFGVVYNGVVSQCYPGYVRAPGVPLLTKGQSITLVPLNLNTTMLSVSGQQIYLIIATS